MALAPAHDHGPVADGAVDVSAPVLPPAPGRWRRFLRDYRYPLLVFVGSRVLSLLAVGMVGWVNRPRGSGDFARVLETPLRQWDGYWYLLIARHGYDPTLGHGNAPAFFPLYPLTMRGLHAVLPFLSMVAIGIGLSTLAFGVALLALWRLTLERFGEAIARRAVTYVAISPLAFVFSAVYTESLTFALILGSFLLLERRRYALACLVGAIAVLGRPVGIVLVPAFAYRIWKDSGRTMSWRLVGRLLPIALLPAALAGFQGYLYWRTGSFDATNSAEARGWGRSYDVLFLLRLPLAPLHAVWIAISGHHDLGLALSALFAGVYVWLLIDAARSRRIPLEYGIFAAGCVLLPALTGTYLGFPRFGLVVFPLFWLLAIHGRKEGVDQTLRSVMPALLVGIAFVSFGTGTFTP